MATPAWKLAMIEKKRQQEEAERKQKEEELAKLAAIPVWKRTIMERQQEKEAKNQSVAAPKTKQPPKNGFAEAFATVKHEAPIAQVKEDHPASPAPTAEASTFNSAKTFKGHSDFATAAKSVQGDRQEGSLPAEPEEYNEPQVINDGIQKKQPKTGLVTATFNRFAGAGAPQNSVLQPKHFHRPSVDEGSKKEDTSAAARSGYRRPGSLVNPSGKLDGFIVPGATPEEPKTWTSDLSTTDSDYRRGSIDGNSSPIGSRRASAFDEGETGRRGSSYGIPAHLENAEGGRRGSSVGVESNNTEYGGRSSQTSSAPSASRSIPDFSGLSVAPPSNKTSYQPAARETVESPPPVATPASASSRFSAPAPTPAPAHTSSYTGRSWSTPAPKTIPGYNDAPQQSDEAPAYREKARPTEDEQYDLYAVVSKPGKAAAPAPAPAPEDEPEEHDLYSVVGKPKATFPRGTPAAPAPAPSRAVPAPVAASTSRGNSFVGNPSPSVLDRAPQVLDWKKPSEEAPPLDIRAPAVSPFGSKSNVIDYEYTPSNKPKQKKVGVNVHWEEIVYPIPNVEFLSEAVLREEESETGDIFLMKDRGNTGDDDEVSEYAPPHDDLPKPMSSGYSAAPSGGNASTDDLSALVW